MSLRTIFTLITLGVIVQGIYSFKMYLDTNFINNDTDIKQKLNRALNGFK